MTLSLAPRFFSLVLLAVTALNPKVVVADPYDGMSVSVLYSSQGSAYAEDTRSYIIQTFLRALNYGALKATADDLYGRETPEFPKRDRPGGPVSGFLRSINYTSKYLDSAYAGALGQRLRSDGNGGDWSFTLETVLSPFELGAVPSVESQLVPPNLAMIWDVAKGSFQEKINANQSAMMDRVTSTAVMNASQYPGGVSRAYAAGKDVLKRLNTDANKFAFLPIYFRFWVRVSPQKMIVQINTVVKPGEINITDKAFLNATDDGPFTVEKVWSRPFGDNLDSAMQVKVQRSWGGDAAENKPLAIVTWGTLVANDVRDVKRCENDCYIYRRTHPNIMLKLTPSNYFFPNGAKGAMSGAVKYLVDTIDARQRQMITMHIIFNQLVFDLERLNRPTLYEMKVARFKALSLSSIEELPAAENKAIEEKFRTENSAIVANMSDTPLVIQFMKDAPDMSFLGSVFGKDGTGPINYKYYVIGRNAMVDPSQAFKDDNDLLRAYYVTANKYRLYNAAVLRIYEKMVAPDVAKQLDGATKANLRTQLQNIDAATGAAVVNTLDPVTALFR